jgi:hypothetical protein
MYINKIYRYLPLLVLSLTTTGVLLGCTPALAAKTVFEERLNSESMRWAGKGIPLEETTEVVDSLTNKITGKIVVDRHTVSQGASSGSLSLDLTNLMLGTSFGAIPGRTAVISMWGSKVNGCFVEVHLQHAPVNGKVDLDAITPTLLEVGVNGQVIELPPQASSSNGQKYFSHEYSYLGANQKSYNSTWYTTRNLFVVDATIANVLANAPAVETGARLTLANGQKITLRLDKRTAGSWRNTYGFNPTCLSPETVQQRQTLAERPLVNACKLYRDTPDHKAALNWLQSQISRTTMTQFSNSWRAARPPQTQAVNLVDVCKSFKDLRPQVASLDWLQTKVGVEVLQQFVQRWQ